MISKVLQLHVLLAYQLHHYLRRTLYIVKAMFMVTTTARAHTTTTLHVCYKATHADHLATQDQLNWTSQNVCTARILEVSRGDVGCCCVKPRWIQWLYYPKTGGCDGIKVLPDCVRAVVPWVTMVFPLLSGPSTH